MRQSETGGGQNRLQAFLDQAVKPAADAKTTQAKSTAAKATGRHGDGGRGQGEPAAPERSDKLRQGQTILVGAHLPPEYNKGLRLLAAEEGTQVNTLIREALDLLFVKKGKDRVVG